MKRLFSTIILAALALASLTGVATAVQDSASPNSGDVGDAKIEVTEGAGIASGAEVEVVTEAVEQSSLLLQLKQKLAQAQYRYYLLLNNVDQAENGLVEIQEVIANLEYVISDLGGDIKNTNKNILSVKSQKERKKMEVTDLEEEVQILELQMEDQKALVGELMTLLYVKQDLYYDQGSVNAVKVLASPNSVSETLQELTYLDMIDAENQSQIEKMAEMSTALADKWTDLRDKQDELDALDSKFAAELSVHEDELTSQEALLEEMRVEETIFATMLASADDREEDLLREIEIYAENVQIMEGKLSGTRVLLSDEQADFITQVESEMAEQFTVEIASEFLDLEWAVSPDRGLTAYFVDSGYVAAFGVQHYALDVRANQGDPVFAAADGVVSEVIFDPESTRYAYVRIAHRKGVMTVYGHLSQMAIEVGDYVTQGQIIGLTGGMPGSVGSGVRTTGPHLHFEVWQDGLRVDPLRYLPIEEVPGEYLPDEFLAEMQAQLEEEIRGLTEMLAQ